MILKERDNVLFSSLLADIEFNAIRLQGKFAYYTFVTNTYTFEWFN